MEDIIVHMKQLGFTEYESKVYISLLSKHPATAYTISQASGVPHSRVYDIARRLVKKGAALLYGKNPESFSPIAPTELIEKIRKDHDHFAQELAKKLKKISFTSDFDPVWNLSDREEALRITRDIIDLAKERIYIGLWDEELEELLPELTHASGRGVQIFFLIYGARKIEFGEVFYHRTEKLRRVDGLGRTIDCVVDSEYSISGSLGHGADCQVVWTKNQGLIKSIEGYIIHDFYLAEIQRKFGNEIENAFGKNLSALRDKFQR